tara:strand:- start:326 stop:2332 length:2007 start_codon:yes stop_codon:yes gene_type:complete
MEFFKKKEPKKNRSLQSVNENNTAAAQPLIKSKSSNNSGLSPLPTAQNIRQNMPLKSAGQRETIQNTRNNIGQELENFSKKAEKLEKKVTQLEETNAKLNQTQTIIKAENQVAKEALQETNTNLNKAKKRLNIEQKMLWSELQAERKQENMNNKRTELENQMKQAATHENLKLVLQNAVDKNKNKKRLNIEQKILLSELQSERKQENMNNKRRELENQMQQVAAHENLKQVLQNAIEKNKQRLEKNKQQLEQNKSQLNASKQNLQNKLKKIENMNKEIKRLQSQAEINQKNKQKLKNNGEKNMAVTKSVLTEEIKNLEKDLDSWGNNMFTIKQVSGVPYNSNRVNSYKAVTPIGPQNVNTKKVTPNGASNNNKINNLPYVVVCSPSGECSRVENTNQMFKLKNKKGNNISNSKYDEIMTKVIDFLKQRNDYVLMGGLPAVHYLTKSNDLNTIKEIMKQAVKNETKTNNNKNQMLQNALKSANYNLYMNKNRFNIFRNNLIAYLGNNNSKYLVESNKAFYGNNAQTEKNESVFQIFYKDPYNSNSRRKNLLNIHLLPTNNPKKNWIKNAQKNNNLRYLRINHLIEDQEFALASKKQQIDDRLGRFQRFLQRKQREYNKELNRVKSNPSIPKSNYPIDPKLKFSEPRIMNKSNKRRMRKAGLEYIAGKNK